MEQKNIKEATTKQAFVMLMLCHWCITKNIARSINGAVYKTPWIFICTIIVFSFVMCFVQIGKARIERDKYNQTVVELQQQLEKYKSAYNIEH